MQALKETLHKVSDAVLGDTKFQSLASETHQAVNETDTQFLTTNFGVKLTDTDNSLKAGERGPTLLEDFHFREKISHFDHERIPERVVHARGAGAHGYFQLYSSQSELTHAHFLNHPEKKTPVFVRFSTVLGSRGSADTVRDVRGFAIKFYTEEGNFDLVGNNIPIFFIQDAIKFADIIHAGKPEPHNEIPQGATAHDNFWDIISLLPESAAMNMWILSDRTLPRSYRMMQGFGVHSFILVNAQGKRTFVKFHLFPTLGTHSLVWDESAKLMGADPDFHRKDLYEAIENGDFPEWEFGIQTVEESDENSFDFDILDATKLIPEEKVPVKIIGKLVLNRNPDNFFAETEQVGYCTSHLVPGIDVSNDPLLQGRHFSYQDTQITRLGGPNWEELPINRPVCPVSNNQRDGQHRTRIDKGKVNYFPNRFGCPHMATVAEGGYKHAPTAVSGPKMRTRGPKFAEHFKQATLFYESLSEWEQEHLIKAAIFELEHVEDIQVRERMVERYNQINFELAKKVAYGVGVAEPTEFKGTSSTTRSPALSQDNTAKNSIKTRKVAFLIGRGYDSAQLNALRAALSALGANSFLISNRKGKQETGDEAQFSYTGCKSVQFDSVVLVGGSYVPALQKVGDAIAFVNEAFKHGKPIVALNEGVDFLARLALPEIELANAGEAFKVSQGVVSTRAFDEKSLKTQGEELNLGKAIFNAMAAHRHPKRDVDSVPA